MYDSDNWHAFLRQEGARCDLNDLIATNSGYMLISADAINDAGRILCKSGNLATGRTGAGLLMPLALIKLEITGEIWMPEAVHFQVRGARGLPVALDCSTNVLEWAPLTTLTDSSDVRDFVDPDSDQIGSRFYRARLSLP
jgi:hypothetical protein